jgi:arylsulfatase A-like enzyme
LWQKSARRAHEGRRTTLHGGDVSELETPSAAPSAAPSALALILDGLRAGTLATLLLTLWSFIAVSGALDAAGASEGAGGLFILTAFGLIATVELSLGAALGAIIALWQHALAALAHPEPARAWLAKPDRDAIAAALVLGGPLLAAIPAALVLGVHLTVTGSFARVTFQALGLAAVAAVGMIAALIASPLLLLPALKLAGRGAQPQDEPKRVRLALSALGVLGALGLVACAMYAARLEVFPHGLIAQAVAAVALPVVLTLAMPRVPKAIARPAWTVGLPLAGLLCGLVCFVGAWSWASSSADMRQAVSRKEALTTFIARVYQRLADKDKDGQPGAMGGADCDDTNTEIYPGAEDLPGDGIDQDCSGEDTPPPEPEDHPSRKIVSLAFDAARKAATRQANKGADSAQGGAQALPPAPKNIVFVLVDTLRPDHLGYMGYERPTSPNLDKLAARSIVFTGAHAPAPHTPRSIPPLFFSRWASHMKWLGAQYNYPKVRPENLGLFEVLKEHGWKNYGVMSHFYFEEKRNLQQGFDKWDNADATDIPGSNEDIAAPRIWRRLEPLMDKLAEQAKAPDAAPFGLFVHLFEPHSKWIAHPEHKYDSGDSTRTRYIAAYDSEITYVDTYIGKILDKLAATGLDKNTVVVIVSDHGEAFMDHGKYFHGQDLYEEILRVPLIIHVPGWPARRIDGNMSLVDVAPTLVDLFDITIPPDFEGISLLESMQGTAPIPADRPIFAELLPYTHLQEHHVAIIRGDYKLIRILTTGGEELYNLKQDPTEKTNLIDKDVEAARAMRAALDEWLKRR